ncbi:MAG: ATP-dependent zinc metalloprotease FtsH [Gemmatimonadetes bacterium]|nr:ATP-dependent zinc metalloprotease FtsH [Gemmatimonadota bacterium]
MNARFRRRTPGAGRLLRLAAACAVPVALATCSEPSEQTIAYSRLKERIAAGQVREVRLSDYQVQATSTTAARKAGAPERWVATRVPGDDQLVSLLEAKHVQYDGFGGGAPRPNPVAVLVLLIVGAGILVAAWRMRRNSVRGVSPVGRMRVKDSHGASETSFDDVAGVDEAKEELEEIVHFLRTPEKFARLGARVPRGVLLVGPPGTGKTLLAKAVAGEAGVPFFSISGAEFVEVYVGVGASRVRKLFQQARAKGRAIIFIDELDAIGKTRSNSLTGANDEREQTLNQLLVEMDGFDPRSGIIVMAATNRPEILDPALLRPGRFDRQVLVDRPDPIGREAILRVHARNVRLDDDVDLAHIAQRTPGFVGADLANVLNEAALLAARADKPAVGMEELDAAIDRVVAGLEKKNRLVNEKERRIVAWHEAGHALVAESVPTAEPVKKVSIIPRGAAALGYTQQLAEDRLLMQEDELLDRLAVLLGGRAAEHIAFGKLSTGASNDLERATSLARRMVCEFGMSARVGPISIATPAAGRARGESEPWSDETAARVEREVQQILAAAFDRAVAILETQRASLDAVAERLLEFGSLHREELLRAMNAATPA